MSAVDVADHGPGLSDPQGHVRCEGCGYRWPCPIARSLPRPLERAEWDLLRALDIDVGYSIYRRDPPESEERDAAGGVVVGRYDIDGATHFRLLDFPRGRPRRMVLRLADVEPATVGMPNAAVLRDYARRLATLVGRQRGVATGEEMDDLADAVALYRAMTPDRRSA